MLKVLLSAKDKTLTGPLISTMGDHEVDISDDHPPLELMKKKTYDVIVLEGRSVSSLGAIKQNDPRAEVIILGKKEGGAFEAVKNGASAYFSMPIDLNAFKDAVRGLHEQFRVREETAELERALNSKYRFAGGVVGRNPQILAILAFMKRIAPHYRIATITGETGTGKEVFAKALHSLSPAGDRPFLVCNCGGLVEGLIESELFGHRRGAFTGAVSEKKGLFDAAGDGTIFLDEIGELPFSTQAHLLRVLQDGEYRPVGSTYSQKARCRVIASTNRNLAEEVRLGRFREDLFYRLTPLTIHLPPLRERKDDIPLLSRFFLENFTKGTGKQIRGISMPAQTALMRHDWPGNVRELQNVVEPAAMITAESFIRVSDLPVYLRGPQATSSTGAVSLEEVIKNHIRTVLAQCGGNRTHASKLLGLSRRAFQRKLEKYSL